MILRACTRCGALSDQTRCERHRPKDDRPSATKRGYGTATGWPAIRARYLRARPHCECGPDCCPAGCQRPSSHVDHIDGGGPFGDNTDANLRALAASCHSRKTVRHDGGFGRRPVDTPGEAA